MVVVYKNRLLTDSGSTEERVRVVSRFRQITTCLLVPVRRSESLSIKTAECLGVVKAPYKDVSRTDRPGLSPYISIRGRCRFIINGLGAVGFVP